MLLLPAGTFKSSLRTNIPFLTVFVFLIGSLHDGDTNRHVIVYSWGGIEEIGGEESASVGVYRGDVVVGVWIVVGCAV